MSRRDATGQRSTDESRETRGEKEKEEEEEEEKEIELEKKLASLLGCFE